MIFIDLEDDLVWSSQQINFDLGMFNFASFNFSELEAIILVDGVEDVLKGDCIAHVSEESEGCKAVGK